MASPARKTIIGVLAVLVLAIAVLAIAGRGSEPYYHGKPLHLWLAELDLLGPTTPQDPAAAAHAIRAIGTNSFPLLATMLSARESPWRNLLLAANSSQKVVQIPVVPAEVIRVRAIDGYTALGEAASNAVPSLIAMLESEHSPEVRACVATVLGRIGPAARSAIPALVRAAQDRDTEVSRCALIAIHNIQMWSPDRGIPEPRF